MMPPPRTSRRVAVASALAASLGAHTAHAGPSRQAPAPLNVLVVTATAGFHHDSIPTAIEVIGHLGVETGVYATTVLPDLESLPALTADLLAQHHVVFFANTSGELPLSDAQKRALLDFVWNGGGFVGTHSATDTLYAWPEYSELIGAYFREHPWSQRIRVAVEDPNHPSTQHLAPSFEIDDEIYVFRTDVRARPTTRVLLSLDVTSVGFTVPSAGAPNDFPLAWCSNYGAGRTLYNALGHADAVWQDPRFAAHLLNAILWTAGRA
jgi:uncharacterized protein